MLLLGTGIGFYASTIFSEVAGIGQSTTPDSNLATNPVSITSPPGSLTSFTVSLVSLNGFAGSVNLNYTLSPSIYQRYDGAQSGISIPPYRIRSFNPDSISFSIRSPEHLHN
jgi:hypothetical protein